MKDAKFALGLFMRRPFQVLVQVTNRCNMKCSFCDFWDNGAHPREELSTDDFRKLAKDLAKQGTFLVSIEGGEPFLRPDLVEIVRAFSEKHVTVLYTNGWHVDAENARALFDAGLNQVGVSIDFPDPARHDAKRGLPTAFARAWTAVERFREAARDGLAQVHVMTVLMRDNQSDLPELLRMSKEHGVGHCLTLLSREGFRRTGNDRWPDESLSAELMALWREYPHFRVFSDYLERIDDFLAKKDMPVCRAGKQSFNLDHLGNVSPCIEKIDLVQGNVRKEPLADILVRMRDVPEIQGCQDCWTLCRGFNQALGGGGTLSGWRDLASRMRS